MILKTESGRVRYRKNTESGLGTCWALPLTEKIRKLVFDGLPKGGTLLASLSFQRDDLSIDNFQLNGQSPPYGQENGLNVSGKRPKDTKMGPHVVPGPCCNSGKGNK